MNIHQQDRHIRVSFFDWCVVIIIDCYYWGFVQNHMLSQALQHLIISQQKKWNQNEFTIWNTLLYILRIENNKQIV